MPVIFFLAALTEGILRDVSFKNLKDQDWDLIWDVHVKGSYKVIGSRSF
jgi:hypothetical protein